MATPTVTGTGLRAHARAGARRLPRSLHPLAWWAWALGLMVAAARTTDPLLLGLILAVLTVVVAARRPDAPWADAFSAALRLGLVVIVARTLLQVLLGAPVGVHVAFTLPEVGLPGWMAGVRLGGLVTWETLAVGLTEGLRLAVMIACVGAANSLAAPSRLLRSVPAALYEMGVAVVVALTFAPHLMADARRVRAARRLRGHDEGRLAGFARSGGPVLDGGLERSIQLAAAMDSRGYGRTGDLPVRQRRTQTGLILAGFVGVLIGLYGLFDAAAPRWLGWPLLALGVVVAVLGLRAAGQRSLRTAYRPDPWQAPEWATAPAAPAATMASVILAAGPAVWTPPLPRIGTRAVGAAA
jgi:energy-coupling factor transport system permease protein